VTTYLLAIDGGSQSTKVSVVDETGSVHASAQAALRPYELGPDGRATHPDDDLWDTLTRASQEALAAFAGERGEIAAVGLCGIRFCRALVGADGRLTEPVLSWMDARVAQPLGAVDPTVQLVTSAGGYLTVRLTGRSRDSAASYQGMWPIDPVGRDWSRDPADLERTGMPRRLLPDLVDPGELLGRVTSEAAEATGIPADLPVYATANDKAVEALGCGLLDPGTVLLSLGTYIAAMTVGDDPAGSDERYWVNSASVPGRYLYESAGIRRGMWTVSWLRDLVSSAAPGVVDQADVQEWLNEGARLVPPGCGGLLTVPDWLAPGHAPHRRGTILGLDGSHGAHDVYRSILEGIVLTMRGHADAMEAALGRTPDSLVVSGGGSRSDLMMQIVADVFGRPAKRVAVADAAGTGAAMCAAVGHGVHPGFAEAAEAMVRAGDLFDPDPRAVRQYDNLRPVYAQVLQHTDGLYQQLAALPT
jgi:sugar (pentulose or hexulose) kinase